MSTALRLHYFPSPNGRKVTIALEEMALPYAVAFVDILAGGQTEPAFLAISPNGRIPALEDLTDPGRPVTLFESGAILLHLARASGRFGGEGAAARAQVESWLFWQMAGLGPMTGQLGYFTRAAARAETDPRDTAYPLARYRKEVRRLYAVLDRRLADREFVADDYSVADMACWPWVDQYRALVGEEAAFPHVARWHAAIGARPAVRRALEVAVDRIAGRAAP